MKFKFVQSKNALFPSIFRLFGKFKLVNDVHPENASEPIFVRPSLKSREDKDVQFENAFSPIVTKLSGKLTFVMFAQLENAFSPILITVYSWPSFKTSFGISTVVFSPLYFEIETSVSERTSYSQSSCVKVSPATEDIVGVGVTVGSAVACTEVLGVGVVVGSAVGTAVGVIVGSDVTVALVDGMDVGVGVGCSVAVGSAVGTVVGVVVDSRIGISCAMAEFAMDSGDSASVDSITVVDKGSSLAEIIMLING